MKSALQKKFFNHYRQSYFFGKHLYRWKIVSIKPVLSDCWPIPHKIVDLLRQGYVVTEYGGISFPELAESMQPQTYSACLYSIQSFECLRALKIIGDSSCRRLARQFILQWIDAQLSMWKSYWLQPAWHGALMGIRLANWVTFYDFFGQSSDDQFYAPFIKSLQIQYDILKRSFCILHPMDQFKSLKGLILVNLSLSQSKISLNNFLQHLENVLRIIILKDGGASNHHPLTLVGILRDLLDIRMALRVVSAQEPSIIHDVIHRIVPVIRMLRHGDGLLCSFEGQADPWALAYAIHLDAEPLIDMVLSLTDIKGPAIKCAEEMGYYRLHHKSNLLILNGKTSRHSCDTAPGGESLNVFQFEWSQRKKRLITLADVVVQTDDGHLISFPWELKPEVEVIYQKDHQLFVAHAQAIVSLESRGVYCSYDREIYLSPQGEVRGFDKVLLGENSLVAVRFILGEGCEILPVKGEKGGILVRWKDLEFKRSSKANTHLTYQFLAEGYEEIVHQSHGNHSVLMLLHPGQENVPQEFKWSFKLVE